MSNRFIDLYSDTKTKPTAGMRKAMAEAEVGDEQKFEDPTVNRLREKVCALLGKEDSVFLPSGTMANQIAIRVHCKPGEEIICDRTAHIITSEGGGPGATSMGGALKSRRWAGGAVPRSVNSGSGGSGAAAENGAVAEPGAAAGGRSTSAAATGASFSSIWLNSE